MKKGTRDLRVIFRKIPVNHGQVVCRNGNGPKTFGRAQNILDDCQREQLVNYFNGACVTCRRKVDECLVLICLQRTGRTKKSHVVITKKQVGDWRGLEPRIKQILGQ